MQSHDRPAGESLREYGRGLAGGLIFSLPLLYTMEVWWSGFISSPERLLAALAGTFALLLAYNNFAGIRHDFSAAEVVIDSVEELGLGIITATMALWLLGRIHRDMPAGEMIGRIVVEAVIVAIGFSVGTAQLGGEDEDSGTERGRNGDGGVLRHTTIAFCGAILFAANVAPTEEIVLISIEIEPPRLLVIAIASALLGTLVLFFASFHRAERFARVESRWQVFAGTIISYATALVASAVILWFFGRFEGCSVDTAIAQIVVLSLPAALGAAAGRLLLQS